MTIVEVIGDLGEFAISVNSSDSSQSKINRQSTTQHSTTIVTRSICNLHLPVRIRPDQKYTHVTPGLRGSSLNAATTVIVAN